MALSFIDFKSDLEGYIRIIKKKRFFSEGGTNQQLYIYVLYITKSNANQSNQMAAVSHS